MKEKKEKPTIHVASCSFGKDSLATILLALEHNEPLDRVVFAEVMFDRERGISGEIPCHIEWIYGTAIPRLESMGVKVDVVRADIDYKSFMLTKKKKDGTFYGHQYRNPCFANGELKMTPMKKYFSKLRKDFEVIQYVGIAIDEPVRLERLKNSKSKISLLEKYGYSQKDTMNLCKQEQLLSPYYSNAYRGGCFFCPNAPLEIYIYVRESYPEMWEAFKQAYYESQSKFMKYNKTLEEVEKEMDLKEWEDEHQLRLFD